MKRLLSVALFIVFLPLLAMAQSDFKDSQEADELQVVGNLREPNHDRSVIRSAERPSRRHDGASNPHGRA
jgi:hypothetical protein